MGKPTICIGENKGADQLRSNCEADQRLCLATRIVQFLSYLNPKFQASSSFLCLYRPVCVRPVRKPHGWFSHEAAQLFQEQELVRVIGHRIELLSCGIRLCCLKLGFMDPVTGKPSGGSFTVK